MTRFVVDASVAVKWFFDEVHTEDARRLLREGSNLLSPDLIRAEVGNVLWKRWRRGDISAEEVSSILRDFENLPLEILSSEPLLEGAWMVAEQFDRSFYDGLYVALAAQAGYRLVTADSRLYNALSDGGYSSNLLWVEDVPPVETDASG